MSETLNMNGLCRCCLSEGEFRSLDAPYECDGNHSHSALLRETFNITISPMPVPDNASTHTICDRCTSQLQDAAQFRNQVLESEKRFTAYVENYLRGDNALSADKIQIEAETLQDEQIEYTLSTYIVKEEIENDLAINEEIEHTSIKKDVVETDNAMAISPDDGNDYVNEFDCKIDVCDDDNIKGDERYPCDICNEIFHREDKLRSHVLDNHIFSQGSRDFSCDITFDGHVRAEYHCAFCTDTFPTLNSLKTHELTHTKKSGYICDYCQKSFKLKNILKRHIYLHTGKYKKYICETCGLIAKQPSELKAHIKNVHEKIRPFKCELCPKTYVAKRRLIEHRRVHTGEIRPENSNNKCHICGKSFVYKSYLKHHLYCHTKPFKCHVCGEGFSVNRLLRTHMLRRHDSSKEKQKQEWDATKANLKYHKGGKHGNIVDKGIDEDVYNNYDNGDGKVVSGDDGDCVSDGVKPVEETFKSHIYHHAGNYKEYICEYCQKSFNYKQSLIRHIYQHTGNYEEYICDYCQRVLKSKISLRRHINHHTGNYKKYICDTCGLIAKQASDLKIHIRNVHEKIKPFKCDLCPKTYVEKRRLIEHRRVHTGELPYECDVCFKRFRSKRDFNAHKHRHLQQDQARTGTEIHNECPICGKRFVYKSILKQHLYWHTKPFKCHFCGEGFSFNCLLRTHMLRRHDTSKEKQKQERNATKANLKYHEDGKHGNIVDKSIEEDVYNNYDNSDGKVVSAYDRDGNRDGDFQDVKEIEAEKKTETERKMRNNNYNNGTREARYTCDFCKEIIYGKHKLQSHVLAKHMLHDSRHFPCPSCGITFRGRIFCIRHMMHKHIRAEYQCAFCIDTFPTPNGVRTHELTHTNKSGYICGYCQKSLKHKETLIRHIYLHTGNYKKYTCEICGVTTKQKRDLKVHIRSVHDKIRPFKCDECLKTYKSKRNLTRHIRVVHRGELPYECDVCFRRFRSVWDCYAHKRRHLLNPVVGPSTPHRTSIKMTHDQARTDTEIRPKISNNECQVCGKNFATKPHLKQHLYIHTQPFKCHVCGEGFSRKTQMVQHQKRHD